MLTANEATDLTEMAQKNQKMPQSQQLTLSISEVATKLRAKTLYSLEVYRSLARRFLMFYIIIAK